MSADRCDYLCFAWGETDRPCAAIVSDRAAVRQFLIDQWLGEECEELDAAMARFDADSDDGDAWDGMDSIDWQFEIGGVRITKVFAIAAAPAAPAAEPVAHLRFRAAMHASPDGNVEAAEWLEVCEPTDIGDDQSPAFAVYDTPGATPAQSREPLTLTEEQVTAAARVLNKRIAESCGLDEADMWKLHADFMKDDARAALQAAHGIGSQP